MPPRQAARAGGLLWGNRQVRTGPRQAQAVPGSRAAGLGTGRKEGGMQGDGPTWVPVRPWGRPGWLGDRAAEGHPRALAGGTPHPAPGGGSRGRLWEEPAEPPESRADQGCPATHGHPSPSETRAGRGHSQPRPQTAPKLELEGPSARAPLRPRGSGGRARGPQAGGRPGRDSPPAGCRGALGGRTRLPAQAVQVLAESVGILRAAATAQG